MNRSHNVLAPSTDLGSSLLVPKGVGIDCKPSPSRFAQWSGLCAAGGIALLAAGAVWAAPGVPQAPTLIFSEDFQNLPPATSGTILTGYTGATGQTYTAAPAWLTACNGLLSSADQPVAGADGQTASCGSQEAWNVTQQLSRAIGTFKGQATPATNFSVSAYTSNNPGAGLVEFETTAPIPLPNANRFIAARVDVAAANCYRASAPDLQFYLMDGVSNDPAGSSINGCSGTLVDMPALGNGLAATGTQGARVGTYYSGGVLISAASTGIRMTNLNGSGGGNDHAFDNVQLLDVSPALDKSFSPTAAPVNGVSTLTFTVTNTTELSAKPGWSFTDNLPVGLVVAPTPAASTNCPSGVVTAAAGSTSIAVTGNLSQGTTSCTVNVNVTSASDAVYTNGPDNITSAGLTPPGRSTVVFGSPVATAVPVGSPLVLAMLSMLLAVFAGLRMRNNRR